MYHVSLKRQLIQNWRKTEISICRLTISIFLLKLFRGSAVEVGLNFEFTGILSDRKISTYFSAKSGNFFLSQTRWCGMIGRGEKSNRIPGKRVRPSRLAHEYEAIQRTTNWIIISRLDSIFKSTSNPSICHSSYFFTPIIESHSSIRFFASRLLHSSNLKSVERNFFKLP
jgi:hypothetical protein